MDIQTLFSAMGLGLAAKPQSQSPFVAWPAFPASEAGPPGRAAPPPGLSLVSVQKGASPIEPNAQGIPPDLLEALIPATLLSFTEVEPAVESNVPGESTDEPLTKPCDDLVCDRPAVIPLVQVQTLIASLGIPLPAESGQTWGQFKKDLADAAVSRDLPPAVRGVLAQVLARTQGSGSRAANETNLQVGAPDKVLRAIEEWVASRPQPLALEPISPAFGPELPETGSDSVDRVFADLEIQTSRPEPSDPSAAEGQTEDRVREPARLVDVNRTPDRTIRDIPAPTGLPSATDRAQFMRPVSGRVVDRIAIEPGQTAETSRVVQQIVAEFDGSIESGDARQSHFADTQRGRLAPTATVHPGHRPASSPVFASRPAVVPVDAASKAEAPTSSEPAERAQLAGMTEHTPEAPEQKSPEVSAETTAPAPKQATVAVKTQENPDRETEPIESGTLDQPAAEPNDVFSHRADQAQGPSFASHRVADRAEIAPEAARQTLREVAEKIEDLATSRRGGRVVIRLNPENLGTVTVVVRSWHGRVDAQVTASNDSVRSALAAGRNELVQSVEGRGMTVNSFNVGREAQGDSLGHGSTHQHNDQPAARQELERAVNLWRAQGPILVAPTQGHGPRASTLALDYVV